MKRRLTVISSACLLAMGLALPSAALAQQAPAVVGKLTNSDNNRVFAGAKVSIKELNISTETSRDGSFRFNSLPAGTYTLVVQYLGAAPVTKVLHVTDGNTATPVISLEAQNSAMADILVKGVRSGQASALNQQRVADRISNIVSADAIGQFPDQNAAEALQRLPGLSIERDQGEGRFVGIRGIDPNLNNVTINGLNIPSPESGVRSVALDVIPSELIQTLEVSKSVTPDMDGDAIGGSVAVKSVSAFDRNQPTTASVTVQGGYADLREQYNPKLAGSVTHQFNSTLGIAAALSWFDRDFGSDNVESNGEDELEQRHYTINRERLGAAVNLDWRPDFNNQYFLRTLYSEFSDDEYRQAAIYTFDDEDSGIERETKDRYESQSIATITLGGEHQLSTYNVQWQAGFARSDEDEPDALYYVLTSDNASITTDLNTTIPMVSQNSAATDLAAFDTDEISFEDNYSKDTETSFKLDLSRPLQIAKYQGEFKFGGKYRSREKDRDSQMFIYDDGFDGLDTTSIANDSPGYGLGNIGPGLDRTRSA